MKRSSRRKSRASKSETPQTFATPGYSGIPGYPHINSLVGRVVPLTARTKPGKRRRASQ